MKFTGMEHQQKLIADMDDSDVWYPKQVPKRLCPCGTILRQSNPETHCEVCLRKIRAEDPKRKPRW